MNPLSVLNRRPIIVAVAGPNGAGKTSFYDAFLGDSGLRFINADVLAREWQIGPYEAAKVADSLRRGMLDRGESFVFETVFSDPVGDKIAFLEQAEQAGYTVVKFFIGNSGPKVSRQRVAIRVARGGHSVTPQKLIERYPRTLANLKSAFRKLPEVWVYDNDSLSDPFCLVAVAENGRLVRIEKPTPAWLQPLLPPE